MSDATNIQWPERTREVKNFAMDSTRWDEFEFRDDDIVIGTWAKSGTTWTQQIVCQLIFNGEEGIRAMDLAPWWDIRILPLEEIKPQVEAQQHRRFIKTHLPADALLISPKAKYIYLARDGRDVIWSWHHHLKHMSDMFYDLFRDTPGRVGPSIDRPTLDVHEYFHEWLDGDPAPGWPYWSHVQSWWDIRHLPNVLLLHFANLKADMQGQIRVIAEFLNIDIDEAKWPQIVEHCTFDYMKKNADSLSEVFADAFEGGLTNFINKGTNGRWRDILSADEVKKYEDIAAANLTADCAHWLATGEMK